MELKLTIKEEIDTYEDEVRYQEISDKDNDINFSVHNMDFCPEDAIISRDLFSALDYINALNKGIELAKKGYEKVIATKEKIK